MDFFQAQDNARKSTTRLVVLLGLAVLSLIVITNLLVMVLFGYFKMQDELSMTNVVHEFDWTTFLTVGAAVSVVILLGSLYKIYILSGGGRVVAESLGGQLIPPNTSDFEQRKVLNVVEEMAVASGTPVPSVYMLADEEGINAFAAGFSPSDAVIGVTRGTLTQLNREQIQGVIAHEFSHILNGDMRLNIRLIGILNGILLIGIIGYYILRSAGMSRHRRSSNDGKSAGAVLALGAGLMVVGFAGTFFGNLIKASVSRQREFLADASAVQFTRNPGGIAGALKRIGGYKPGSAVQNPAAPEMSHSFFCNGVRSFFTSMFATHPPLSERIKRVDPNWDGKFPEVTAPTAVPSDQDSDTGTTPESRVETLTKVIATGVAVEQAASSLGQIGHPGEHQLRYARSLIQRIPNVLLEAAREPYGARAIIYALVIDTDRDIRAQQLSQLQDYGDKGIYELTGKLLPEVQALDERVRLPLVDLSMPGLREMSLGQFQLFRKNLAALIEMDSKIDLFEWSLHKILVHHLDSAFLKPKPSKSKYSGLEQVERECELLFSLLAYAGNSDPQLAALAFSGARDQAELPVISIVPKADLNLASLDQAMDKLNLLKPLVKPKLLKACLACISADEKIVPKEMELFRAVSDSLDCPMPPVDYGE